MRSESAWPRLRIAILIVRRLATAAAIWTWREPLWAIFGDQELVQNWVAGFGPWAPVASVSLNAAQVLLAPVPGHVIGLMNGYLYGVWLGTLYSMLGLLVGTTLAMVLGRFFGRPLVEKLVKPETLARWDRIAGRRGPLVFFLVFLVPGLPDDILCFVIGLRPLPIPGVVVLATLGRLPGVFVSCWFGAHATELPAWAWIPLVGGTAGLAFLFVRYQRQIEALALRIIRRLTGSNSSETPPIHSEAEGHH